uniref:tRNA pseudouridine(55) synthase n=1 Tax=Pogona vitticeps TaxID=103695 RepID=A0ABM5G1U0_9SAUR
MAGTATKALLLDALRGKAAAAKLLSFNGWFALDKLNRLRDKLLAEARIPNPMKEKSNEILKIGHGGTLDNSASGVLDWITKEALENVLQKFTRNIIYSALKKDGQRLSTLVRKGESVEPKPARPVTVYSLTLKNLKPPLFTFELSSATMQELTRTKQGPFALEEHALSEDRWTTDEIIQSLEHCMRFLWAKLYRKELKTKLSEEHPVSCEDKR